MKKLKSHNYGLQRINLLIMSSFTDFPSIELSLQILSGNEATVIGSGNASNNNAEQSDFRVQFKSPNFRRSIDDNEISFDNSRNENILSSMSQSKKYQMKRLSGLTMALDSIIIENQIEAAKDIKRQVEIAAKEFSLEKFENFERDLFQRIFSLILGDTVDTSITQSEWSNKKAKVGGILVLKQLIDCTSAASELKLIRFADTLSEALKKNTDFALLELIADAFGHIARFGILSHLDCIERELCNALDWLAGNSQVYQRFAACSILQQLAENSPSILFNRIKDFFDLIWSPLWDARDEIRYAASRAVSSCLAVLVHRTYHLEWYCWIYDRIHEGFLQGSPEYIHGSMLCVIELLKHTGDFMIPRFKEITTAIMMFRENKSRYIRSSIVALIPVLASYCPDVFAKFHLSEAIEFLIRSARTSELKAESLLAIGNLCKALKSSLLVRMEDIVQLIRDSLLWSIRRLRNESTVSNEALICIGNIVIALGEDCHSHIMALLDLMLQSGLTMQLIETLKLLSDKIPNQSDIIQLRLLEEATKILGGDARITKDEPDHLYSWCKIGKRQGINSHLKRCGVHSTACSIGMNSPTLKVRSSGSTSIPVSANSSPPISSSPMLTPGKLNMKSIIRTISPMSASYTSNSSSIVSSAKKPTRFGFLGFGHFSSNKSRGDLIERPISDSTIVNPNINQSPDLILLALHTIGSLLPQKLPLLRVIQNSIFPYLHSLFSDVRREAGITCIKMVSSFSIESTSSASLASIEELVSRLIVMVVADTSSTVRLALIQSFPTSIDRYLARSHHIDTLIFLLADESIDVRLEALKLLGRLSLINQGTVHPHLRLFLVRLLSELVQGSNNRIKEESVLLICCCMREKSLHPVVRAFLGVFLKALPLKEDDNRLESASLETIGEICVIMRDEALLYAESLLPIIVKSMKDSTSRRKQEIACRTLGQLVAASGLVVKPYLQYPQLLPWMLNLLFRNTSNQRSTWSLRSEILRTIGLIGALDPAKYEKIINYLQSVDKKTDDITGLSITNELNEESKTIEILNLAPNNSFDLLKEDDAADVPSYLYMYEQSACKSLEEPEVEAPIQRLLPSSDDYYPQVAILSLLKILKDSSLTMHHSSAAQTIVLVFKSLGIRSVSYLDSILPYLLRMIKTSLPGLKESILQQVSVIVTVAGIHISQYLPSIFEVIEENWNDHLDQVLTLVQEMSTAASEAFQEFIPRLLSLILSTLVIPSNRIQSENNPSSISLSNTRRLNLPNNNQTTANSVAILSGNQFVSFKLLEQVLRCCNIIRVLLRPHIHLVVPSICRVISELCNYQNIFQFSRILVLLIKTLRHLCTSSRGTIIDKTSVVAARIVHTLVATINSFLKFSSSSQILRSDSDNAVAMQISSICRECFDTFVAIGKQLGPRFINFDELIRQSIDKCKELNSKFLVIEDKIFFAYNQFSADLRVDKVIEYSYGDTEDYFGCNIQMSNPIVDAEDFEYGLFGHRGRDDLNQYSTTQTNNSSHSGKLSFNPSQLARSWDVSQRTTANDWKEWLRRLKIDFIRESPSPSIRVCAALAQNYLPLAGDLFHASFVSCWLELSELYQDSLIRALQTVFKLNSIPPEVLQTLLKLAEFMEHDVEALPIPLSVLAELAERSRAYAKALHYRELEFQSTDNPNSCFESLININKKLDQYDSAVGAMKVVTMVKNKKTQRNNPVFKNLSIFADSLTIKDSWLAKLGYWNEALIKFERRIETNSDDAVAIGGKLKCLEALGRWEEAIELCKERLDFLKWESERSDDSLHTKAAVIGARAAWSLSDWDTMDEFSSKLPKDNIDGSFMKAVLATHQGRYQDSAKYIDATRKQLDSSISALLSESYSRSYLPLIMVQQCSELEEIMEFKSFINESDASLPVVYPKVEALDCNRRKRFVRMNMTALSMGLGLEDKNLNTSSLSESALNSQQIIDLKSILAKKWRERIRGCYSQGKAAMSYWKYLLNGHRLIFNQCEDLDLRLQFAALCRLSGNFSLSERVLNISFEMIQSMKSKSTNATFQLVSNELHAMEKKVQYAMLKQMWIVGRREEALVGLTHLIHGLDTHKLNTSGNRAVSETSVLLTCILKLSQWKLAMIDPGIPVDASTRKEVLDLCREATKLDSSSYVAWHSWGLANYRAIEEMRGKTGKFSSISKSGSPIAKIIRNLNDSTSLPPTVASIETLIPYVTNALMGLLRAIALGTKRWSYSVTQDMLCVLTLWFKYVGKSTDVKDTLQSGLNHVHVDNWLGVLPQLIARIDHPEETSRLILSNLLIQLGKRHAQALVFPLSVALKSPKAERITAAQSLMTSLSYQSSKVISEAVMVSQELIRVTIVWEEMWHETLEEASRQYFGDGNVQAMLDTLTPLYKIIEAGPQTILESAFIQQFGRELSIAWEYIKKYVELMQKSGKTIPMSGAAPKRKKDSSSQDIRNEEEELLSYAWDQYYNAFQNINKKLATITSLELHQCSPLLLEAKDLLLGVPGTYNVTGTAVGIKQFIPTISIIKSKQRPRKLRMIGENGRTFIFLLKGHEDLRQDERAMQLFGLVNALLIHDHRHGTSSDSPSLTIERYAVIPLSPTAGLISWVPNCDTLHDLIREYRDTRRVILNVEHKLMLQLTQSTALGFDGLTLPQKLEVFEYALQNTTGEDLAKILWLKSNTSEAWLQRRINYTRSLAVMSMVGYILGLGDRHPSNLMLNRNSGKVLHIDFGDCFEVAMHREKFPEKVPFRLTRMLVNAMEVSGIEGNFRATCERVMSVLRENRDSLIAVLEAFVYDPLVSWRLLNPTKDKSKVYKQSKHSQPGQAIDNSNQSIEITSKSESTSMNGNESKPSSVAKRMHLRGQSRPAIAVLEPVVEEAAIFETYQTEGELGSDDAIQKPNDSSKIADSQEFENLHQVIGNLAESLSEAYVGNSRIASSSFARPSVREISLAQTQRYDKEHQSAVFEHTDDLSEKAILVIRRVMDKLTGLDFNTTFPQKHQVALDVAQQVERLMDEAMSNENLCRSFIGWCPFW